jgi:hypothetical protein
MDTQQLAGPEPATETNADQLAARLELMTRAVRWGDSLDAVPESYVTAERLRLALVAELEAAGGVPITGIEIADALPTAEEAQAIIAAEDARQDYDSLERLRSRKAKRLRLREADERHTPGRVLEALGWGPCAAMLRKELRAIPDRRRGEHAGSVGRGRPRTQTRSRGAGRPRVRRTAAASSGGSSDDDPGGGGDPDPEPPAVPVGPLQRSACPHDVAAQARIGGAR